MELDDLLFLLVDLDLGVDFFCSPPESLASDDDPLSRFSICSFAFDEEAFVAESTVFVIVAKCLRFEGCNGDRRMKYPMSDCSYK